MIVEFHTDQVKTYGGRPGIRDEGLLEVALAQPQASFDDEYVHKTLFEMASVYGFRICQNHPFYDGNKHTALIAMYTFLFLNGYKLTADKKSLYAIIIDLAGGKVNKKDLAGFLKEHAAEI